MSDNEKKTQPPQGIPPEVNSPVVNQIIINLHANGQVTGTFPTDMKRTAKMVGDFFKFMLAMTEYVPPSPILTPPPGFAPRREGDG